MWYSEATEARRHSRRSLWALQFTEETVQNATNGGVTCWEAGCSARPDCRGRVGFAHSLFRAIYGNWSFHEEHRYVPNCAKYGESAPSGLGIYVAGKREFSGAW